MCLQRGWQRCRFSCACSGEQQVSFSCPQPRENTHRATAVSSKPSARQWLPSFVAEGSASGQMSSIPQLQGDVLQLVYLHLVGLLFRLFCSRRSRSGSEDVCLQEPAEVLCAGLACKSWLRQALSKEAWLWRTQVSRACAACACTAAHKLAVACCSPADSLQSLGPEASPLTQLILSLRDTWRWRAGPDWSQGPAAAVLAPSVVSAAARQPAAALQY